MPSSEIIAGANPESELIGCGRNAAKLLKGCAVTLWLLGAIVFLYTIWVVSQPDSLGRALVQLGICALLAVTGGFFYVCGGWIETYSWVVARSSSALRKLTGAGIAD